MEKQCFKCERIKPLTLFYRHPQMADGHLNKCKECAKGDVRQNYHSNKPHFQAYERRRLHDISRVEARRSYSRLHPKADGAREYREKNPEKYRAHTLVNNSVRDGGLDKPIKCEVCQQQKRLHGHHDDYSRPLWVGWACARCHGLITAGIVSLGRFHQLRRFA